MIGEQLGNYRIVGKIGEGGMGAVYRAEHTALGSPAAVKVLLPSWSSNDEIVSRFFNEAKATTTIDHPGIVQVFDYGKNPDGHAYLVMELLRGESLEARLRRVGRLPVGDALRIIRHCASALEAAHVAGIVHRDLKPENIFMIPDPQVEGGERAKVLDFGIAKLTDDQQGGSVKTRTGSVMGTPIYMAPEQCRGAGAVDHRADIYSLGCVLFHLVCGRPPFLGPGIGEIIASHIKEPAPSARSINPEIAPDVEVLLLRTLTKDPNSRHASMAELLQDLERVETRSTGLAGPAQPWSAPPETLASGSGYAPADSVTPAGMPSTGAPGSHAGMAGTGSAPPGSHAGMAGTGSAPPGSHAGMAGTGSAPPGSHAGMAGTGSAPPMSNPGSPHPHQYNQGTLSAAAAQSVASTTTRPGTRRGSLAVIAIVALVTILGGVVVMLLSDDGPGVGVAGTDTATPGQEPDTVAASPSSGAPQTPQAPDQQSPGEQPGEQPAEQPAVTPPQPITLTVESKPRGALVYATAAAAAGKGQQAEPLGQTPFEHELLPVPGEVTLYLKLAGYEDAEVSFRGDRDGFATVAMSKVPKADDADKQRRRDKKRRKKTDDSDSEPEDVLRYR